MTTHSAEDASDVVSSDAINSSSPFPNFSSSHHVNFSSRYSLDESTFDRLVDSEPHHMPHPDYPRRCTLDLTARQDSINWILKVNAHHRFRPVTAFLSVNYFDRFLSSHSLLGKGWAFQLLSVACLSLAAKMEEPYVPLLIELQLSSSSSSEPCRFVFEPKTVQRMELSVMANLNWRLRSVTPFDYLDYFIPALFPSSGSKPDLFTRLVSASSHLILNTTRVPDFLGFPPSVIAAAAVLSAAGQCSDSSPGADGLPECIYRKLSQERVRSCHQLMEEYLVDTCPPAGGFKDLGAEPPPPPPSPVGVLDAAACGSCDTTRSDKPVCGSGSGAGSSESEPPNKRLRSSASDVQQDPNLS